MTGQKTSDKSGLGVLIGPRRVSRATQAFNVHAYHTKVPVEAIQPYIELHTQPGDVVLDPFAGSGMTGLAAALGGRRAILNDLSPAAAHISRNYTTPCDPASFDRQANLLMAWAEPQIDPLYEVACPSCDGPATTEYLVWSDVRLCPHCSSDVIVWNARSGDAVRELICPSCSRAFDKRASTIAGELPVSANLACRACKARQVVEPRPEDLRLALADRDVPYWYPSVPFGSDWEMWRGGHRDLGIERVADFWSRRNLVALSVLWEGIAHESDPRVREALRFVFTSIVNRASRRYQWNAKRPTNVLGGTLYIASLRYEFNVMSLWRRKLRAVGAFYRETQIPAGAVSVLQGSATDLRAIPSGSVDYVFTDPPFGANIYYADASLLWEAWLGDLTDRGLEAVVSRKRRDKSVDNYRAVMSGALTEMRRCLKPDGLITMVFQNTNEAVWQALRDAAADAGLFVHDATTLHKSQPSFKGVKAAQSGERVAASDVIMTMSPTRARRGVAHIGDAETVVRAAIAEDLGRIGTFRVRSVPHLYAVAVSALINAGLDTAGWTFDRVAEAARLTSLAGSEQLSLGISD